MKSAATSRFWRLLAQLPAGVQGRARKAYLLWSRDHSHPSIDFKKVGKVWSARIDDHNRALADVRGDTAYWFWIGPHPEYERLIRLDRKR